MFSAQLWVSATEMLLWRGARALLTCRYKDIVIIFPYGCIASVLDFPSEKSFCPIQVDLSLGLSPLVIWGIIFALRLCWILCFWGLVVYIVSFSLSKKGTREIHFWKFLSCLDFSVQLYRTLFKLFANYFSLKVLSQCVLGLFSRSPI